VNRQPDGNNELTPEGRTTQQNRDWMLPRLVQARRTGARRVGTSGGRLCKPAHMPEATRESAQILRKLRKVTVPRVVNGAVG